MAATRRKGEMITWTGDFAELCILLHETTIAGAGTTGGLRTDQGTCVTDEKAAAGKAAGDLRNQYVCWLRG